MSHRISPAFVVSFEKWKEGTDLLEDLKFKQISALKSEPTHTHTHQHHRFSLYGHYINCNPCLRKNSSVKLQISTKDLDFYTH